MYRCNKCKKESRDEGDTYIQIYVYKENYGSDICVTPEGIFFCESCWHSIKNLDGIPALFKGNVKKIIKEWGLSGLFD